MNPDDEDNQDQQDELNRPGFGMGRPPIFETPEEMQEQIMGYFNGGMKKRRITAKDGKSYLVPIPTITGLVLYLGFADRHFFYDYEKKEDFSHTIKRARTFIENEYEEILVTTGNAGAIFALKNFGWVDKHEFEDSSELRETRNKLREFYADRDGLPDNGDAPDTA